MNKITKEKVEGVLDVIESVYNFFVGKDQKYSEPVAKIFILISLVLGSALYMVSDKYFLLAADARATISELGVMGERANYLQRELSRLESSYEICISTKPSWLENKESPKPVVNKPPTYEVRVPRDNTPVNGDRRGINPNRLVEIINN